MASSIGGCFVENGTAGFWPSQSPDFSLCGCLKGVLLLERNQRVGRAVTFDLSGRDTGRMAT